MESPVPHSLNPIQSNPQRLRHKPYKFIWISSQIYFFRMLFLFVRIEYSHNKTQCQLYWRLAILGQPNFFTEYAVKDLNQTQFPIAFDLNFMHEACQNSLGDKFVVEDEVTLLVEWLSSLSISCFRLQIFVGHFFFDNVVAVASEGNLQPFFCDLMYE